MPMDGGQEMWKRKDGGGLVVGMGLGDEDSLPALFNGDDLLPVTKSILLFLPSPLVYSRFIVLSTTGALNRTSNISLTAPFSLHLFSFISPLSR